MIHLHKQHTQVYVPPTPAVERVLQIGEGNFIRAFADWLLQALHEEGLFDGSVVLTPARATGKPKIEALRAQDGLFTVWTRGLDGSAGTIDRTDVVATITRIVNPFEQWSAFLACAEQATIDIVISNTTELGISYVPTDYPRQHAPATFPARLAAYLERRFVHFGGAAEAGLVILPCELIENNADVLRDIVLRHATDWHLWPDFARWVTESNAFCNTLVDRIVPGFPGSPNSPGSSDSSRSPDASADLWQRLGYEDTQLAVAEPYYLWAIDSNAMAMRRLPFHTSTLNVYYTEDLSAFRIRKLRILNGTHTLMAALGLFLSLSTVREAILHPALGSFVRRTVEQVVVPHSELDAETLRAYAATVFERFLNPYIDHQLTAITLNSLSKFRIRLLPVMLRYNAAHGVLPEPLCLCLAAQLLLYDPARERPVEDAPAVVEHVARAWQTSASTRDAVGRMLASTLLWEQDLTALDGLVDRVSYYVDAIRSGRLEACLGLGSAESAS